MKIAVISAQVFPCPPSGYSGLEMIAWYTAKGLAELGHEVSLIAPDGSWCPGVTIIPTGPAGMIGEEHGYGGFPDLKNGNQVVRKAHPGYWQCLPDFDVIIDSSWQKSSYLLKMEGRLKAPVLGVLHAPVNTMYQSLPPVEKPCFVCISDDQRSHFEGLFGRPARTCRNGIDLGFYKPLTMVRTNRFLFLARFSGIKGPDLAIEACKEVGVGLDLVGDTSITNEPELLKRCQAMADGKQIRIIGPCSRGETVYWYSQAHCMIHPNQRFREPWGLAPVESLACGCPYIGWDYGACRETVYHCENFPNLISSKEELMKSIRIAAGPLGITSMDRERCRIRAMEFSIENMCKRYEELCREALSGGW